MFALKKKKMYNTKKTLKYSNYFESITMATSVKTPAQFTCHQSLRPRPLLKTEGLFYQDL